jgi:hypothetical protein
MDKYVRLGAETGGPSVCHLHVEGTQNEAQLVLEKTYGDTGILSGLNRKKRVRPICVLRGSRSALNYWQSTGP